MKVQFYLAYVFPTERTRKDLQQMKSGIEKISETLQTLKASPTKEKGQFPQPTAHRKLSIPLKWLFKAPYC